MLLRLLQEVAEYPKIYWKSRGSDVAVAGYGSKESEMKFSGKAFDPSSCRGVWSSFPESLEFSPATLHSMPWGQSPMNTFFPKLLERTDAPSFNEWWKVVTDALDKIGKEKFKKVVLARQTTLRFEDRLDPVQVLHKLMPRGDETSLFLLQLDPETTFLGATPEKLFERKKRKVSSEALAGTKTWNEEWTTKETAEIEAIQVFLHERLLRCCTEIQWHPPEQKNFANLNHLYQGIEGSLKDEVSDEDLLEFLHPTPGLGGFPQKEALDYIREVEPISRGWYGGTIGKISADETDIAVSIRSALIRGSEMHLFAGAGIVRGSKPDQEWEELDRKIGQFIKMFT